MILFFVGFTTGAGGVPWAARGTTMPQLCTTGGGRWENKIETLGNPGVGVISIKGRSMTQQERTSKTKTTPIKGAKYYVT